MEEYRKKPVVIEAVQWTGINLEEIKSFVGKNLQYDIIDTAWEVGKGVPHVIMKIHTLEGDHECTKGDFIIKGVNGEFYPCKPDIFEKTYEYIGKDSADKMTKADRIRSMSDEELAEFIEQVSTDSMETISFGTKDYEEIWEHKETALQWLQSEVEK